MGHLMQRAFSLCGVCVCAFLLVGCTQPLADTPNASQVFKHATSHDSSIGQYVIDPPDEITVRCPNVKEIDGNKQTVRPDGKISFNLIGEVKVAGLTPAQVQRALQEAAARYYTSPDIKVEVVGASKFYCIVGRGANNVGKRPFTGNDSMVKALTEAALNDNAWPQQVLLVRPERDGHPAARAIVDFKNMAETGDVSQNYLIEAGDIVNLRDSPIASLSFKLQQALGPLTGGAGAVNAVRTAGAPGSGGL